MGWLDVDHFAYLRMSNGGGEPETFDGFDELVEITISGQNGEIGIAETIISANDFRDAIDDESLSNQFNIDAALAVNGEKNGFEMTTF